MINLLKFFETKICRFSVLENTSIRSNSMLHYSQQINENSARTLTQSLSNSEINKIETSSQEEK